MNSMLHRPAPWTRALLVPLRIGLALAMAVMTLLLLAVGLVVGLCVVGWMLLRGRRPTVQMLWRTAGRRTRPAPSGDVVDVQAREVDDPRLR